MSGQPQTRVQSASRDTNGLRLGLMALTSEHLHRLRVDAAVDLVDVRLDAVEEGCADAILIGWQRQKSEVARRVRERGFQGPLMALLARPSPLDAAVALSEGCDDVQVLPLHPLELIARVTAIRQRMSMARQPSRREPKRIVAGRLSIGADGSDPRIDGRPLKVSPNCSKVLAIVAASSTPVPQARIAMALYGAEAPPSKTINTYLCMLRSLMAAATGEDSWLKLHDGGYVLHRTTPDK